LNAVAMVIAFLLLEPPGTAGVVPPASAGNWVATQLPDKRERESTWAHEECYSMWMDVSAVEAKVQQMQAAQV
jgi:hypothetical protein